MRELTAAEQRAWEELLAAEMALDEARLRFVAVSSRAQRQRRGHLRALPSPPDETTERQLPDAEAG